MRMPRAPERTLVPEDPAKADKVFLTNSVRWLRRAVVPAAPPDAVSG